jgi:hypothetical protein
MYDAQEEVAQANTRACERDEVVVQLNKEVERKSLRLKKEKEMRQSVKEELKRIRRDVQADAEVNFSFNEVSVIVKCTVPVDKMPVSVFTI